MSAVKRIVSTSFWEDDKVVDTFTPEDKYFMLYLLTNPHTKQIGIYPVNLKVAAFETGYSKDSVSHLLDRFENVHGIIKRSITTTEVLIKNFLRHSIVKGGKPVLDCLYKEAGTVKDRSLLVDLVKYLSCKNDLLDTVSVFVRDMSEKLEIQSAENDNDNDDVNDNDNDNDVRSTYGKRTASVRKRPPARFVPPTVEEVAAYCKERGNTVDPQHFVDYYSANGWVQGRGKPIKDWKAAVRTWERNNAQKGVNSNAGSNAAQQNAGAYGTAERGGYTDSHGNHYKLRSALDD